MPTIKDIARVAAVSQGTVSNVLNGKQNVSAEKIMLVKQAAEKLGYTINSGAQSLRKGNSNIVGLLLPNMNNRQYIDFYQSFNYYAESHGFTVKLYFSNDNPNTELELLRTMKSDMCDGVTVISALGPDSLGHYQRAGFATEAVVFAERRPSTACTYVGFDYRRCGQQFAEHMLQQAHTNYRILLESHVFSSQQDLLAGFAAQANCNVADKVTVTSMQHGYNTFFELLECDPVLQTLYIANYSMATVIRDMVGAFFPSRQIEIVCISPLFILPLASLHKYELNYRLLGKTCCEKLLQNLRNEVALCCDTVLQNDGFRSWHVVNTPAGTGCLKVLTLDSPSARILESVSGLFTKDTGIKVEVDIRDYDAIYEALVRLDAASDWDIIRIDHTWMSWFSRSIFTPLEEIDPTVVLALNDYMPSLKSRFSLVDNKLYALPETPSSQLLFFRKDLFEDPVLKRQFWEQYKTELKPPTDFKRYNAIAKFFTKAHNPNSPTPYGSSLTLGNTGVAGTEFLARYFALDNAIFSPQGQLYLKPELVYQVLLQMIEVADCCSPQPSLWWRHTAREFAEGETAMTILFSNFASEMLNHESKIIGKVGYAMVPGGNPILGGGSIGVSRYSSNQQQSLCFIRWLCSNEAATLNTFLGSVSPCPNTYDNYEVVDKFPWLPLSRYSIEISKAERAPHLHLARLNERAFLDILGSAVIDCCTTQQNVQEVVARVMRLLQSELLLVQP